MRGEATIQENKDDEVSAAKMTMLGDEYVEERLR
jgi:hypothetical protein